MSKNNSKTQTKAREFEDVAERQSEHDENDSDHANPLKTVDKRHKEEMVKLSLELRKSLKKLDVLQKSIDAKKKAKKVEDSPDVSKVMKKTIS